ncbi:hypothetical protein PINS_up011119 [Pythium insidiosum]|nr:hypothetical protein PINS_up011119 [Pythium insidiosum]
MAPLDMQRRQLAIAIALLRARAEPFELELSDRGFRVLWLSVVVFHVAHAVAYLYECLQFMKTVTMRPFLDYLRRRFGHTETFHGEVRLFVLTTSAIIAALHLYAVITIARASLRRHQLEFLLTSTPRRRVLPTPTTNDSKRGAILPSSPSMRHLSHAVRSSWSLRMLMRLSALWDAYFAPSSPHFETVFNVRKAVEITAQIFQLYNIFARISARWATDLALVAVVPQCVDTRSSRVFSLTCDIWLASFFTILVPFITYLLYLSQLARLDDLTCWADPLWLVPTANLLQLLLVNTWLPALSTRFTAITMLLGLEIVKSIVTRRRSPLLRVTSASHSSRLSLRRNAAVVPATQTPKVSTSRSPLAPPHAPARKRHTRATVSTVFQSLTRFNGAWQTLTQSASAGLPLVFLLTRGPSKLLAMRFALSRKLVDTAFMLVGGFVIAMHLRSMARTPWFADGYSCAVLRIRCDGEAVGSASQLQDALLDVLPGSVQALELVNCPALEVPATIQQLRRLVFLKIVNSTLREWPPSAALTPVLHDSLAHVLLLNVTNVSSLPAAIATAPISTLIVHRSDLAELPTDVQWKTPMDVLLIERSALTQVPPLLLLTRAQTLSLASNRITQVPAELLYPRDGAAQRWSRLALSDNPITSWPLDNDRGFVATSLYVQDTEIESLPSGWTQAIVEVKKPSDAPHVYRPGVWASGTRLCDDSTNASLVLERWQRELLRCAADTDKRDLQLPPFDWLPTIR